MKVELVKISNLYFNRENKILVTSSLENKKRIMLELFRNSKIIEAIPVKASKNTMAIVVSGIIKDYNYCAIVDDEKKYYWIIKTEIFFEKETKTRVTLEYDEINNTNLIMAHFTSNMRNNNFFLNRTNMPNVKATFANKLLCSEVCSKMHHNEVATKEKIYEWSNHFNIDKGSDVVLFIEFSSYKYSSSKGRPPLQFVLDSIAGSKVRVPPDINTYSTFLTEVNGEYTSYIVLVFDWDENNVIKEFADLMLRIGNIEEIENYINDIKIDFIPSNTITKNMTSVIVDSSSKKLCNIFLHTNWDGTTVSIPSIKLETINIDYESTHLSLAHEKTSLFCKKWNSSVLLFDEMRKLDLVLSIGIDNTYIKVFWGNDNFTESYDSDNINNNLSLSVNAQPYLRRTDKENNNLINTGITAIVQALAIGGGAFLSGGMSAIPAMATMLGISSLGGAGANLLKGSMGYALEKKQTVKGGITSKGQEKKYFTNTEKNADIFDRNSIHIQRNFISESEKIAITNDRKKKGDYINEYFEADMSNETFKNETYIEGIFNDFSVDNYNVNLKNWIIEKTRKGLYINTMKTNKWVKLQTLTWKISRDNIKKENTAIAQINGFLPAGTFRLKLNYNLGDNALFTDDGVEYVFILNRRANLYQGIRVRKIWEAETSGAPDNMTDVVVKIIQTNGSNASIWTVIKDVPEGVNSYYGSATIELLDSEDLTDNLKTINGNSLIGTGDLIITGTGESKNVIIDNGVRREYTQAVKENNAYKDIGVDTKIEIKVA